MNILRFSVGVLVRCSQVGHKECVVCLIQQLPVSTHCQTQTLPRYAFSCVNIWLFGK